VFFSLLRKGTPDRDRSEAKLAEAFDYVASQASAGLPLPGCRLQAAGRRAHRACCGPALAGVRAGQRTHALACRQPRTCPHRHCTHTCHTCTCVHTLTRATKHTHTRAHTHTHTLFPTHPSQLRGVQCLPATYAALDNPTLTPHTQHTHTLSLTPPTPPQKKTQLRGVQCLPVTYAALDWHQLDKELGPEKLVEAFWSMLSAVAPGQVR
jgi:hypothetical protein